jgi:tetratricopeptide (TPR) repeat protein
LYVYIARIRKLIDQTGIGDGAPVRVVRRSRGYVLDVEPDRVDVHRFRRLTEQARDLTCPETRRLVLLRQSLSLWQGTPLAGLPGEWASHVRQSWQQEHIDTVTAWAAVELRAGNAAETIGRLTELTHRYPLAESLAAALMRALHAAGRAAEALSCYVQTRQRLVEELGVDPGNELQALHTAILRGELVPPAPVTTARAPGDPPPAGPAQLPLDVPGFAGRRTELASLHALLPDANERPTTVVVCAMWGTAGVGKTALAVHWAHQVRDRFPDGQLYVNLRGFDPTGTAMTPAEAIRGFLDAFEVPARRIPGSLEAQAALFRTLVTGKRVLLVLDNARDAEQVRPLLPGAPGCLVLVTSRNQLASLVAAEGARPLALDLLTPAESHDLLARRLGTGRVAADPDAVNEIITCCARLPLALAVAAARAATDPSLSLAALAGRLSQTHAGLSRLTAGDATTDVRAVFSWSYHTLGGDTARLFRLLGLAPGPDVSTPAAVSLAGIPVGQVQPLLADLTRTHLLTEHAPGRYAFHDLLRAYATELAQSVDPDAERRTALHRLLDHYAELACAAALLLNPHRDPIVSTRPAGTGAGPADPGQALAWFTAEHQVLLAAVQSAVALGLDTHAYQLAWALADFLERQGHWQDWVTSWLTALPAAHRRGDRPREAHGHHSLASAYTRLGRHDEAHTHLRNALRLYQELDDLTGQAHTHNNTALTYEQQGRAAPALEHSKRALQLYRKAGHSEGQARALNNIGWCLSLLGDYPSALDSCRQALELNERIGNRHGQAIAWDSLGYAHHQLGQYTEAIASFRRSAQEFHTLGDRYQAATTLARIGDTQVAAGDHTAARETWLRALTALEELHHPDADVVRAKLQDLDQGTVPSTTQTAATT